MSPADTLSDLREVAYRTALGSGVGAADAEDVAQETVLRIWMRQREKAAPGDIQPGLAAVTSRRLCIDLFRHAAVHREWLAQEGPRIGECCPEEASRDICQVVRESVRALPPSSRAVLEDQLDGVPPAQTAARLGLNPNAVRIRGVRGRKRLRAELGPLLGVA